MKIKTLAAIDIGSNAVRLLINHIYKNKKNQPVFNKASLVRLPIRLGKDVFENKAISPENRQKMVKAMQSYRNIMDIFGVEDYMAFATSAMREAENGPDIAKEVLENSGIDIQIIKGKKEASIIFKTELKQYVQDNKNYLYVDVGGGSTELTLLEKGEIIASKSFKVGTVRFLRGKVKEKEFDEKMQAWIQQHVTMHVEIIGSGGNINYIYKHSKTQTGKPISADYLQNKFAELKETTYDQRLFDYNMKPDRADVIVPALNIYSSVVKWAGAEIIHVPKIGLADGMIQYLFENKHDLQL